MVTKGILKRIEEIEARADNPWCDKWIGGLALDDIPWLCELARKLLAVAEASRDVVAWWKEYAGSVPAIASIYDLEQALAALEEVE